MTRTPYHLTKALLSVASFDDDAVSVGEDVLS